MHGSKACCCLIISDKMSEAYASIPMFSHFKSYVNTINAPVNAINKFHALHVTHT